MDYAQIIADYLRMILLVTEKMVFVSRENLPQPSSKHIYVDFTKAIPIGYGQVVQVAKRDANGAIINDIDEVMSQRYALKFNIHVYNFTAAETSELPIKLNNQIKSSEVRKLFAERGVAIQYIKAIGDFGEIYSNQWLARSIFELTAKTEFVSSNTLREIKHFPIENKVTNSNKTINFS